MKYIISCINTAEHSEYPDKEFSSLIELEAYVLLFYPTFTSFCVTALKA